MARFSDLPEEVVAEILSLLPAESLMPFKCVRKSWYALIKNPKFVSKQLTNQIQSSSINNNIGRNLCILFFHRVLTNAGNKESVLSLLSYDNKTEPTLTNGDVSVIVKNMDLPHDATSPYLGLMGCCNGIICLAFGSNSEDIFLVNPEIREFRALPESCIPTPPPHYSAEVCRYNGGVGFGYDPKTEDYKVVKILKFEEEYGYLNCRRVEVYTLSTDSWREINNVVIEARYYAYCFEKYFNGVFYWWASDDYRTKDVILAFDLSDEVFQNIPMPDSFLRLDGNHRRLMELNESLALFHYPVQGFQKFFDIWVMDKFGLNGTWSKILTIGPLEGIVRPLVFWKKDELLMQNVNGQVVSYSLSTKEIKNHLPLFIQREKNHLTETVSAEIYVRSLLSVKRGNKLA